MRFLLEHLIIQKLDPKSRKGFPIRLNHYQTDISKIKRDLEWAPTFDLLNGLKDSFVNDFNNKIFFIICDI